MRIGNKTVCRTVLFSMRKSSVVHKIFMYICSKFVEFLLPMRYNMGNG